jgi:hypothetical protein
MPSIFVSNNQPYTYLADNAIKSIKLQLPFPISVTAQCPAEN